MPTDQQLSKLADEIEKTNNELSGDSGNDYDKLNNLAGVAASKRQLWKTCSNKPCRRRRRCTRQTANMFSCQPYCSQMWGEWENGFFAGAALALGLKKGRAL
ncbi:MAG: hypothetical protein AB3N20_19305 [Rhizobiaceae bacterium]